jgi:hypothetical protein
LCNFLHSPVTSSFLGPNILFRTLFSSNPIQDLHDYGFVYFNFYIVRQQMGRQKTLNRMVASIPQI